MPHTEGPSIPWSIPCLLLPTPQRNQNVAFLSLTGKKKNRTFCRGRKVATKGELIPYEPHAPAQKSFGALCKLKERQPPGNSARFVPPSTTESRLGNQHPSPDPLPKLEIRFGDLPPLCPCPCWFSCTSGTIKQLQPLSVLFSSLKDLQEQERSKAD